MATKSHIQLESGGNVKVLTRAHWELDPVHGTLGDGVRDGGEEAGSLGTSLASGWLDDPRAAEGTLVQEAVGLGKWVTLGVSRGVEHAPPPACRRLAAGAVKAPLGRRTGSWAGALGLAAETPSAFHSVQLSWEVL